MDFDLASEATQIVTLDDTFVPIRFRRGVQDTLIVLFHGAARRTENDAPVFQGFLNFSAHQISISDPEMLRDSSLQTSWYLGQTGQALKPLLSRFLEELGARLGARRFMFVGGSSGAFAALNMAHGFGSQALAIAACPQTNLLTYWNQRAVSRFRASCFPELLDNPQLAAHVDVDLSRLYGQGFSNTVILIHSAGDREHLAGQFTGFLQGFAQPDFHRTILNVGYWGVRGHSGSVPVMAYRRWVEIALAAADWNADTLLDLCHIADRATALNASGNYRHAPPASRSHTPSRYDIQRADLLRDYHFTQMKGS